MFSTISSALTVSAKSVNTITMERRCSFSASVVRPSVWLVSSVE